MQFDHHGPGFLFLLVLLHFGLQALVVLQGLLATFDGHVEAGEDGAVPGKRSAINQKRDRAIKYAEGNFSLQKMLIKVIMHK